MKLFAFLATSSLALAACSMASAESSVRDDCNVMISDPAAQEQFAERGLEAEPFCDCVISYIAAQPETEEAQMRTALEKLADEMEESETGADEAIGTLMAEAGDIKEEPAAQLRSGVRLLGSMMNAFGEDFSAGDACPAP